MTSPKFFYTPLMLSLFFVQSLPLWASEGTDGVRIDLKADDLVVVQAVVVLMIFIIFSLDISINSDCS